MRSKPLPAYQARLKGDPPLPPSNTRIEETANEVFERFTHVNPLAGASYAGNLQLFPRAAQEKTHSAFDDLEQSVA